MTLEKGLSDLKILRGFLWKKILTYSSCNLKSRFENLAVKSVWDLPLWHVMLKSLFILFFVQPSCLLFHLVLPVKVNFSFVDVCWIGIIMNSKKHVNVCTVIKCQKKKKKQFFILSSFGNFLRKCLLVFSFLEMRQQIPGTLAGHWGAGIRWGHPQHSLGSGLNLGREFVIPLLCLKKKIKLNIQMLECSCALSECRDHWAAGNSAIV